MDNKGFTLVELLATVAIIAIVGSIATAGVISIINNSKNKSEEIFVNKISNLIDDYLDLYPPNKKIEDTIISFEKCGSGNNCYEVEAYEVTKDTGEIHLIDLVNTGIITKDKLINPKNKEQCLISGDGPKITVYRDNEYVYYYSVDFCEDTPCDCNINEENGYINTFSENLKIAIENKSEGSNESNDFDDMEEEKLDQAGDGELSS